MAPGDRIKSVIVGVLNCSDKPLSVEFLADGVSHVWTRENVEWALAELTASGEVSRRPSGLYRPSGNDEPGKYRQWPD